MQTEIEKAAFDYIDNESFIICFLFKWLEE